VLVAALGVEALDELVDGTKGAALPLIRGDLHLNYAELGLLIAVPLLVGSLLELPLGLVAGSGRRRSRLVLAGGLVLAASLVVVAFAGSFPILLAGLVAFFPASGAFVSLTQAALMDIDPDRHQQRMAAWNLAGSAGAVAGPLLLAAVLTLGGTWRSAYLLLAGLAGVALAIAAARGPARAAIAQSAAEDDDEQSAPVKEALRAVRDGQVARWLILLQIIDLLLDVLTGYVGVYLVDVAKLRPAEAAIAVAIRLGGMLLGDALFVPIARRVSGRAAIVATAAAASLLYPAFLLLPAWPAKLGALALLSIVTACWYPVAQAGLYGALPGRSGVAVFWSSAAGLIGAVGPLLVGLLAQQAGLSVALGCLAITPLAVLAVVPRGPDWSSRKVLR
jgi:MFS transporter, FSR family, fosmidomycin resistance protein